MPATSPPASRRRRASLPRWAWITGAVALVAAVALLVLATFDFGHFRQAAERKLTAALHRRVTIDAIERIDAVSLAPRIRLVGVHVAQPAWAGRGDMLAIRAAVVRVPVLGALIGRAHPSFLSVEGARVALVHDAGKRANWQSEDDRPRPDSTSPDLTTIVLKDVRFTLDDRRRKLLMAGDATSDEHGVRVRASGTHRGTPARVALTGAAVLGGTAGKPWPFRAAFASPLATIALDAAADRPLDFSRFAGDVSVAGDDLTHLDDILLVGVFPTQPVRASAHIRRVAARWELTRARIAVGRSDLAGSIVADRRDGRSTVAATLRSTALDFADLANDVQHARAEARQAAIGDRIVPATRIELTKLRNLDGRLTLSVAHLLSRKRSVLRSLDATVALDHATLTAAPLAFGLAHGRLEGKATVVQPEGQRLPRLTLDLWLVGGRLEDFIASGDVAGPLRGRIALAGDGATVRDAIARADGSVALASRGGAVTRAAAEVLGRNLGAAFGLLIGGSEERTPLRCFAARFTATKGMLRPSLFALDTGVMQAAGRGTIGLDGERIALTLDGRSKHPGLVKLPAPIEVGGTLSHPAIETSDAGIASGRTILNAIGAAVSSLFRKREAPAPDLDCGALMARAGV